MRILYLQAADVACMHSYELIRGFQELGHEVFSDIVNYDGVKRHEGYDYDKIFVSTSGAHDYYGKPPVPYVFIDGRDTADLSEEHRPEVVFKTNGGHPGILKLPACVDPAWLTEPSEGRPIHLSFLTGHEEHERGKAVKWVKELGGVAEFRANDARPLVARYPAMSCNIFSEQYHKELQNTRASVNGPGGGIMTKRFFEIIASGCICLNFIPNFYYQPVKDILDALPDEINFPKEAVFNFSTKEELEQALKDATMEHARKTYEWAKGWTFKEKALYVLKYS